MAVAGHDVGIGAAHGAEQELVAHRAAVDDEVDVAGAAAVEGRQPVPARRGAKPSRAAATGTALAAKSAPSTRAARRRKPASSASSGG